MVKSLLISYREFAHIIDFQDIMGVTYIKSVSN